jgi:hypothetical protein
MIDQGGRNCETKKFFATEERENSRVRKTLPHPDDFVCAPYSTVEMPPRILSEYPTRSIYIYIARSNRFIDNRQYFIPNNNRKGNKRRRRRRQTNDTLVPWPIRH